MAKKQQFTNTSKGKGPEASSGSTKASIGVPEPIVVESVPPELESEWAKQSKTEERLVVFNADEGRPVLQQPDLEAEFEKTYGWIAPNNVAGLYKAMLKELFFIRKGIENGK